MKSPFTSAVAKEDVGRDASEHKRPDFLQIKFAASDTLNLLLYDKTESFRVEKLTSY